VDLLTVYSADFAEMELNPNVACVCRVFHPSIKGFSLVKPFPCKVPLWPFVIGEADAESQ